MPGLIIIQKKILTLINKLKKQVRKLLKNLAIINIALYGGKIPNERIAFISYRNFSLIEFMFNFCKL